MYTVQDGQLVDQQYSSLQERLRLPSAFQYVWLSIGPKQQQTLYFRTFYTEGTGAEHYTHLSIEPMQPMLANLVYRHAGQALYAGFMLLLCVVGGLMYFIFRERVFLYFSGMIFFAVLYFADRFGLFILLTTVSRITSFYSLMLFAVTGIVVFTSLFISTFVQFRENLGGFSRFYNGFAVFTVLFPYLFRGLFPQLKMVQSTYDAVLIVWVLLTVLPVFLLAWRGKGTARYLIYAKGLPRTAANIEVNSEGEVVFFTISDDIVQFINSTSNAAAAPAVTKAFPNPAAAGALLSVEMPAAVDNGVLELIDAHGRQAAVWPVNGLKGQIVQYTLPVHLQTGIYMYCIIENNQQVRGIGKLNIVR